MEETYCNQGVNKQDHLKHTQLHILAKSFSSNHSLVRLYMKKTRITMYSVL